MKTCLQTQSYTYIHLHIYDICLSSYVHTRNEIILYIIVQLAFSLTLWKPFHMCTCSNTLLFSTAVFLHIRWVKLEKIVKGLSLKGHGEICLPISSRWDCK